MPATSATRASARTVKNAVSRATAVPRILPRDIIMTVLALVSVVLVALDIFVRGWLYDTGLFVPVLWTDFLITLLFLGEFVKASAEDGLLRHARRNWFDVLGMIPMLAFVVLDALFAGVPVAAAVFGGVRVGGAAGAGGMLRFFRFVRVVRIATAWSRFLRATNMTFGEQVAQRFFDKYRRIIVAELTTPILVAGITVSQEIIIRMKFLESAGHALDMKRPEIHDAVVEAMKAAHVPESMITKPLVERIVNEVERSVVDTAVETLTGPALNKLTQEMIVEVLDNFKQQLKSPEARQALLRMTDETPPPPPDAPASAVTGEPK